jgi:putative nucleotidyltransferase with HDIG domain
MADEQKKFQQILDVSLEFSQAKDVDLLLEKILGAAKKLANAEAGSIYIADEHFLRYHHTQNQVLQKGLTPGEQVIYQSAPESVAPGSLPEYVARTGEIVNIPDLQQLSEDAPYFLENAHSEGTHYQTKALIAFPLKHPLGKALGVLLLINPRNEAGKITPIADDDMPFVRLFATHAANAIERAQTTRARIMGILQILTTLRDTEETISHFNRVGAYAAEIYEVWAQKKGVPQVGIDAKKDTLRMAAMLHDIGKLAIPNLIRSKPGKLTSEEYETIKQHTIKGAQLLMKYGQSEIEKAAAQIALTHHENWDGSGYPGHVDLETGQVLSGHVNAQGKPLGKKGEEIPVFGRVTAVADVYDALMSSRVYRKAWKEADVLKELKKRAGTKFDPEMIEAFFGRLETIHAIAKRYPD